MTQVKVCGITNEEDAICAVHFGAAALGFIFYSASPRFIEPTEAKKIISKLRPQIAKVGVFVNESASEIKSIAKHCSLDFIQLHGDESPAFCRKLPGMRIIKAVFLQSMDDVRNASAYQVAALLADTRRGKLYGGTGLVGDWKLAGLLSRQRPLILAGGLNPKNVERAVQAVMPQAVDVNSGVEISPGKKSPEKLARFIEIVRRNSTRDKEEKIFRGEA